MNTLMLILAISVAGPVLGSLIGVIKRPSPRFMADMLSFAAGVMLAISFLELLPEAIKFSTVGLSIFGLVAGALVLYCVDKIIPHIHPSLCSQEQGGNLEKTAVFLIMGIFIHNFPEGMAIALGAVSGIGGGLAVGIGIAVHNIPEGICTSAPYYYCTKKRMKSFLLSSATAVPVILGFFFAKYMASALFQSYIGILMAATAGFMIYISADELIPSAFSLSNTHDVIFSLLAGVCLVLLLGLI